MRVCGVDQETVLVSTSDTVSLTSAAVSRVWLAAISWRGEGRGPRIWRVSSTRTGTM